MKRLLALLLSLTAAAPAIAQIQVYNPTFTGSAKSALDMGGHALSNIGDITALGHQIGAKSIYAADASGSDGGSFILETSSFGAIAGFYSDPANGRAELITQNGKLLELYSDSGYGKLDGRWLFNGGIDDGTTPLQVNGPGYTKGHFQAISPGVNEFSFYATTTNASGNAGVAFDYNGTGHGGVAYNAATGNVLVDAVGVNKLGLHAYAKMDLSGSSDTVNFYGLNPILDIFDTFTPGPLTSGVPFIRTDSGGDIVMDAGSSSAGVYLGLDTGANVYIGGSTHPQGLMFSNASGFAVSISGHTGTFINLNPSNGDITVNADNSTGAAVLTGAGGTIRVDQSGQISVANAAHALYLQADGYLDVEAIRSNSLQIASGSNKKAGTFTLTAGAATIANTSVTAHSVIHVTVKTVGGTRAGVPDIVPTTGTGFTAATASTDTSTYNYWIEDNN